MLKNINFIGHDFLPSLVGVPTADWHGAHCLFRLGTVPTASSHLARCPLLLTPTLEDHVSRLSYFHWTLHCRLRQLELLMSLPLYYSDKALGREGTFSYSDGGVGEGSDV